MTAFGDERIGRCTCCSEMVRRRERTDEPGHWQTAVMAQCAWRLSPYALMAAHVSPRPKRSSTRRSENSSGRRGCRKHRSCPSIEVFDEDELVLSSAKLPNRDKRVNTATAA